MPHHLPHLGGVQGGGAKLMGRWAVIPSLACALSCALTSDRMALCCPWAMSRPPMLTSYRHAWGGEWKARGGGGSGRQEEGRGKRQATCSFALGRDVGAGRVRGSPP